MNKNLIKLNRERLKRTVPAYLFTETQKAIINKYFEHKLTQVVMGGKKLTCVEFNEDAFDILDDIESFELTEAISESEKRGLATRISTLAFQCIRELQYISGGSLVEIANSIRIVARIIALAVVTSMVNISIEQSRRLLPLVRII